MTGELVSVPKNPDDDRAFACVCWDWYDPIPVFSNNEVPRFYANHVGQGAEPSAP